MDLPALSGLEALRRLDVVLPDGAGRWAIAAGAADDVRLQVVRTHGLADTLLPLPCPDGVLLRRSGAARPRGGAALGAAPDSAQAMV